MKKRNASNGCFRRMVSAVLLALSACFALPGPSQVSGGTQPEKIDPDEFLLKYRLVLRDLELLYGNVQVEGLHVSTRPPPDPTRTRASSAVKKAVTTEDPSEPGRGFFYARSDGREKMLLSEPGKPASTGVVNSGTRKLRLHRRPPENGSWYVELDFNSPNDELFVMKLLRMRLTTAPYSPGCGPDFPEHVSSAEFKILEVSRATDAGSDLAKVKFQYIPKDEKKASLDGWFRVDLAMNWVIRDYEFESHRAWVSARDGVTRNSTFRTNGFVNYRRENGNPLPTEIEIRLYNNNRKVPSVDNYKISKYVIGPTPPTEFTLAAFGLGDYDRTVTQVQTRSTYRTAVLSVGAFFAAFLLFCIGRSIQKARKRPRASTPDQPGRSHTLETTN